MMERIGGAQQPTGDEGSYLHNCQTKLVIVLQALSPLFWHFISTTAYHLVRYEPSYPLTKELHADNDYKHQR